MRSRGNRKIRKKATESRKNQYNPTESDPVLQALLLVLAPTVIINDRP